MKASHPRRSPRKPATIARRRVLVIEDNPQDRELVGAFLDAERYEIQTAEAGEVGLSAATSHPPDIVLLDLRLPDLDGYEVCRLLRQEKRTKQMPIVIITASDDPALNRLAYAAGAQACLTKPFRKEALVTVIEAVLVGTGPNRPSSRRGKEAPSGNPQAPTLGWENIGSYRGSLVWVKQVEATRWAAAVTPLPLPSQGRAAATAPPDELVFPEGFDSPAKAEAAAKRYIDREHDRQVEREIATGGDRVDESDEYLVQRRFVRFPVSLPVIGHAPQLEQGEILGEVRTVSVGGLMVEFPVELSPSSFLDLALLTQRGPLEAEAQIVWTATTKGTIRHGLAFPEPKSPDFISKLSAETGMRAETAQ